MASPFQIHRFYPPKRIRLSPKSQQADGVRQFSLAYSLMYCLRCAVFASCIDAALEGGGELRFITLLLEQVDQVEVLIY